MMVAGVHLWTNKFDNNAKLEQQYYSFFQIF